MRVAIISDLHFGFANASEREEDSFIQGREAIEAALDGKADVILIAGDVFDSRVPTQDILAKTMEIFQEPLHAKSSKVKVVDSINKKRGEIAQAPFRGVPVIAIHGTHERRGRGLTNPLQVTEKAGLLVHLHCQTIVLEAGGEKLAVHGLSGVPERYAKDVLEEWNPKAVEGATNILLLHQNIDEFLYTGTDFKSLELADMPKGFDLVVNGHIHWACQDELKQGGKFLIPGSSIRTQLTKQESEIEKRIYFFENGELEFKKLESPREFHYKTLEIKEGTPSSIISELESFLEEIPIKDRKPLVKVILKGSLKKGYSKTDISLSYLEKKFKGKLILRIAKNKLESETVLDRSDLLSKKEGRALSIEERGQELLKMHLGEIQFEFGIEQDELLGILSTDSKEMALQKIKEAVRIG
jgi:DNA repair exonuclease SbcCD nuclease subunit